MELRSGQAMAKFQGAAAKSQLSNEEIENAAVGSSSDADECNPMEEDAAGSSSESGDEENVDDGLGWVTSCLLDEDMVDTRKAAKAVKPVTPRKGAKTPIVASPGSASTATASTKGPQKASSISCSLSADEDATRRKFRGKSVDDILEKVGWKDVKDSIHEVQAGLQQSPFTTMLLGGSLEKFVSVAAEYRKKAVAAQKALVTLDIKVKKWTGTPESVLDALAVQRRLSKALVDSLAAFTGNQKQQNPSKMELARGNLTAEEIPIPMSFNFLFFKEKASELIRFHHIDEYVAHSQVGGD